MQRAKLVCAAPTALAISCPTLPTALPWANLPVRLTARGDLYKNAVQSQVIIASPEMSRIPFNSHGKNLCPVCYLLELPDPVNIAACGIAIGSVSAVIADSPGELAELMASACAPHQQRIAQFMYACSQLSGVDWRVVLERTGGRPSGPLPEGTLIHLAKDDKTRCGQRRLEDKWPDNERFVYQDKAQLVNCAACLRHP